MLYVTRGLSHPLDALNLYYMHKNPSIGRVVVVPFFGINNYGSYDRNYSFGERGMDLFQEGSKPNLIGFELAEVFGALDQGDEPKSNSSEDICAYVEKAYKAYTEKREISEEEETLLNNSGLSTGDRYAIKSDKTRLFDLDELNNMDIVHYDFMKEPLKGFASALDKPFFTNSRENTAIIDRKDYLPTLSTEVDKSDDSKKRAVAICKNISTEEEIHAFMDAHSYDKVIIKPYQGAHGVGIYTISRDQDGVLTTSRNGKEGPSVASILGSGPKLIMERLEPEKGDIRLIAINGNIIGAYNRLPAEGNDIANITGDGGGTPHDYVLTADDRKAADKVLRSLKNKGINFVGLDFMADKEGNRHLIEVNAGYHGGLEKIHDYELKRKPGGMTAGERHTQGIVDAYKSRGAAKETAIVM